VKEKEFGSFYGNYSDEDDLSTFSEALAASLAEELIRVPIPQLSGPEQINLRDIIECVSQLEKHRRSMDDDGFRFLLFFRQQQLRKGQSIANGIGLSW